MNYHGSKSLTMLFNKTKIQQYQFRQILNWSKKTHTRHKPRKKLKEKKQTRKQTEEEPEIIIEELIKEIHNGEEVWRIFINAKISSAMAMAQKTVKEKPKKTSEEIVPKYLHFYLNWFKKKNSERFSDFWLFDHAIDFKPDFILKDCKVYPLFPQK